MSTEDEFENNLGKAIEKACNTSLKEYKKLMEEGKYAVNQHEWAIEDIMVGELLNNEGYKRVTDDDETVIKRGISKAFRCQINPKKYQIKVDEFRGKNFYNLYPDIQNEPDVIIADGSDPNFIELKRIDENYAFIKGRERSIQYDTGSLTSTGPYSYSKGNSLLYGSVRFPFSCGEGKLYHDITRLLHVNLQESGQKRFYLVVINNIANGKPKIDGCKLNMCLEFFKNYCIGSPNFIYFTYNSVLQRTPVLPFDYKVLRGCASKHTEGYLIKIIPV